MEENVVNDTPVVDTQVSDDDFFADVDNEVIESSNSDDKSEESENSTPNETDDSNEKTEEVDYKPLLEALSKKVKYNGENVSIESIEDLISNYQKGLNYDKKQEQYENLQNGKVQQYVSKKAKELGMSVDEYISQVENYEREQEKAKEQAKLEEMIGYGVPKDIAEEVIATSQLRKQLQAKENELKEKEEAAKRENDKNKQYADFIEKFPGVKPESIPKSVFEAAQSSDLVSAYKDWLIQDLQTKLSIEEQNKKNASSAVRGITETGTTKKVESKDLFLEGFDSD